MTAADVVAFYASGVESGRAATAGAALEFERTKEVIARHLEPRSTVADVGGGIGRYAEWLASQGHAVELVDPVAFHVEAARVRAGDPPRFGARLGDARALPFEDGAFDAVLLLGPLYHLGEEDERLAAIAEAGRVCRPGGLVFAAAISRFTLLIETFRQPGRLANDRIYANVLEETRTGRRVVPERRSGPFPDAYFHLPEELEDELSRGRLRVEAILGVEGPGMVAPDLDVLWNDATTRERLLRVARETEGDPHLPSVSAHLLAVARAPS